MTLEGLAAMGYTCGVETLDEALGMVLMHHYAYTAEQLLALNQSLEDVDLTLRCADILGPERCAREDRELDEALSKSAKSADGDSGFPTG